VANIFVGEGKPRRYSKRRSPCAPKL